MLKSAMTNVFDTMVPKNTFQASGTDATPGRVSVK
jgi:hypothetical protein